MVQQGDELGTADAIVEWATSTNCWPNPITPAAAPFPWDDSINAGFTSGEPWLPIAPNYRYANAKTQYANDLSHLGVVRLIAAMRKSPAIGPHVEVGSSLKENNYTTLIMNAIKRRPYSKRLLSV